MGGVLLLGGDQFSGEVIEEPWSTSPKLHRWLQCVCPRTRPQHGNISTYSEPPALIWACKKWLTKPASQSLPPSSGNDVVQFSVRHRTYDGDHSWREAGGGMEHKHQIWHIHELRSLLGHLFHMAQCSHHTKLFINCMLATISLSHEFKKDTAWFMDYHPWTNRVYIIDEDHWEPVHIFVDTCASGAKTLCQSKGYHAQFPAHLIYVLVSRCRHFWLAIMFPSQSYGNPKNWLHQTRLILLTGCSSRLRAILKTNIKVNALWFNKDKYMYNPEPPSKHICN